MEEKVRLLDVARKAWLLLSARSGIYALYGLAFFCLLFLPHLLFASYDPEVDAFPALAFYSGLVSLAMLMALSISLQHFSIASCRNATTFFPQRGVAAFFKYLLVSIVLVAIGLISIIIAGLPFAGVLLSGVADSPDTALLGGLLLGVTGLGMCLGGMIPPLRLAPVLPAIAMGDDWDYGKAWRMTKGYTVKLVLLFFLFMAPPLLFGMFWGLVWGDPQNDPALFNAVNSAFSVVITIVFTVCFGVLYQKLLEASERSGSDFILEDAESTEW